MNNVPAFVSVVFMVTTFVTVGIFLFGVRSIRTTSLWQKALLFLVPFGLIFQFVVASSGFYLDTTPVPPRLSFSGPLLPFPDSPCLLIRPKLGRISVFTDDANDDPCHPHSG